MNILEKREGIQTRFIGVFGAELEGDTGCQVRLGGIDSHKGLNGRPGLYPTEFKHAFLSKALTVCEKALEFAFGFHAAVIGVWLQFMRFESQPMPMFVVG